MLTIRHGAAAGQRTRSNVFLTRSLTFSRISAGSLEDADILIGAEELLTVGKVRPRDGDLAYTTPM